MNFTSLTPDEIRDLLNQYRSNLRKLEVQTHYNSAILQQLEEYAKVAQDALSDAPIPALDAILQTETTAPAAAARKTGGRKKATEATAAAAPKRRGRQPKTETAAAAAAEAPKRRGRKPKTEEAAAAAAAEAPKRRGRKPKTEDAAAAAAAEAPKRRGRQPKTEEAAAAAAEAPKKPGRQPKAETAAAAAAEAPKRRGRKPKTEAAAEAPKRRGRKPKAESAAAEAPKKPGRKPKAEADAAAAPKKPGRPSTDDVMSEWDDFVVNSLQAKQHVLTTAELVAIAKANPENKLGEAQTKVKLNRSLQKLVNKKEMVAKVEKPGRGHYYALTEWVDENKGVLPKKYIAAN